MPIAIAADVVVLPTPPEPAQMQISLALEQLGDAHSLRSSSSASCSKSSRPSSGSKR